MIREYSKHYFVIDDKDDNYTVLNKRYHSDRDRIGKLIDVEQRLDNFDKRYDEIKSMKSKTSLQQLQLQAAIESLLND